MTAMPRQEPFLKRRMSATEDDVIFNLEQFTKKNKGEKC